MKAFFCIFCRKDSVDDPSRTPGRPAVCSHCGSKCYGVVMDDIEKGRMSTWDLQTTRDWAESMLKICGDKAPLPPLHAEMPAMEKAPHWALSKPAPPVSPLTPIPWPWEADIKAMENMAKAFGTKKEPLPADVGKERASFIAKFCGEAPALDHETAPEVGRA